MIYNSILRISVVSQPVLFVFHLPHCNVANYGIIHTNVIGIEPLEAVSAETTTD